MTDTITLIATAKFGLENVVREELAGLGYGRLRVFDGGVELDAALADIPRLNLWLRSADRVLLKVAEFEARTFDELFEQTKALPWEEWIGVDGRFPIIAKSVQSLLRSARSCQSIVKKAVVERLKAHYHTDWFPETGAEYVIQVSVRYDVVTLTLDTSGAGLHKRGYRAAAVEAPLKETFAAGLVLLSQWQPGELLIDPMCGSGTILIEAALLARNIAPGLQRDFAAEDWPIIPKTVWREARQAARAAQLPPTEGLIAGYDVMETAVLLSLANAQKAGVADDITFAQKDVRDLWIDRQYGVLISNPPYGVRMDEFQTINQVYISLNKTFRKKWGWSVNILTADEKFPDYFKRSRPDRARRFYNGRIPVHYYQYDAKP